MSTNEIIEVCQYKHLLFNLVMRDLTVRYKRSVLGFLWTMLNPVLNTIVLAIVFSSVFRFDIKYFVIYLISGLLLWQFFSNSTVMASRCLQGNGPLIKRVYIPKPIFVFSTILSNIVNLGFALVSVLILLPIFGSGFHLALLFLPLPLFIAVMFSTGIAFMLSAAAVFFNDIIEMYQIILLPWMYLTPIIYPLNIIPDKFLPIIKVNPMYYILECFRLPIYMGQIPNTETCLLALICAVVSLLVGYMVFAKLSDTFVYYV